MRCNNAISRRYVDLGDVDRDSADVLDEDPFDLLPAGLDRAEGDRLDEEAGDDAVGPQKDFIDLAGTEIDRDEIGVGPVLREVVRTILDDVGYLRTGGNAAGCRTTGDAERSPRQRCRKVQRPAADVRYLDSVTRALAADDVFEQDERRLELEGIENAGATATDDTPLAWFSMETDGGRGAALTLRLWPGDLTIPMGRFDFHGRWINWTAP